MVKKWVLGLALVLWINVSGMVQAELHDTIQYCNAHYSESNSLITPVVAQHMKHLALFEKLTAIYYDPDVKYQGKPMLLAGYSHPNDDHFTIKGYVLDSGRLECLFEVRVPAGVCRKPFGRSARGQLSALAFDPRGIITFVRYYHFPETLAPGDAQELSLDQQLPPESDWSHIVSYTLATGKEHCVVRVGAHVTALYARESLWFTTMIDGGVEVYDGLDPKIHLAHTDPIMSITYHEQTHTLILKSSTCQWMSNDLGKSRVRDGYAITCPL